MFKVDAHRAVSSATETLNFAVTARFAHTHNDMPPESINKEVASVRQNIKFVVHVTNQISLFCRETTTTKLNFL